jgi:hypothetical protein
MTSDCCSTPAVLLIFPFFSYCPYLQSYSFLTSNHYAVLCPCLYLHREGLQQWDEVDFIGIRDLGVAVAVNVLPKKVKEVSFHAAVM